MARPAPTHPASRRSIDVSNELDLANRVAIVTGSARNIGRAIAIALARAGAAVVITTLQSAEAADSVAAEIRAEGGRALVEARRCARTRAGRRPGGGRGRGVRGPRHPGQQCRGAPRNRSGDRHLRGLSGRGFGHPGRRLPDDPGRDAASVPLRLRERRQYRRHDGAYRGAATGSAAHRQDRPDRHDPRLRPRFRAAWGHGQLRGAGPDDHRARATAPPPACIRSASRRRSAGAARPTTSPRWCIFSPARRPAT